MNRKTFLLGGSAVLLSAEKVRAADAPATPLTLAPTTDAPMTIDANEIIVRFSPGGTYLLVHSRTAGKVFSCATGKLVYRSPLSRIPWIEFTDDTHLIDSGQRVVDLADGQLTVLSGELERPYGDGLFFFDATRDLVASHRFGLRMVERASGKALWEVPARPPSLPDVRMAEQLAIDRVRGRIVFLAKPQDKKRHRDYETIVASVNLEGKELKEEFALKSVVELPQEEQKVDKKYRRPANYFPVLKISPDGRQVLVYQKAGTLVPLRPRLLTLGNRLKTTNLPDLGTFPPYGGRLLGEGELGWQLEFVEGGHVQASKQLSGKTTTLLLDGNTGRVRERIEIQEARALGYPQVTLSPDATRIAAVRQTPGTVDLSVSLHDGRTGELLHVFDDDAVSTAVASERNARWKREEEARQARLLAEERERKSRQIPVDKEGIPLSDYLDYPKTSDWTTFNNSSLTLGTIAFDKTIVEEHRAPVFPALEHEFTVPAGKTLYEALVGVEAAGATRPVRLRLEVWRKETKTGSWVFESDNDGKLYGSVVGILVEQTFKNDVPVTYKWVVRSNAKGKLRFLVGRKKT